MSNRSNAGAAHATRAGAERVRVRGLFVAVGTVWGFVVVACASTSAAPAAVDAGGGEAGASDVATATPPPPIDAAVHDGPYGTWYSPAAIPSGACDPAQPAIELTVNPCCRVPDTPELTRYRCECVGGAWRCKVLWQGAGWCEPDAGPDNNWNAWTPACEDGG